MDRTDNLDGVKMKEYQKAEMLQSLDGHFTPYPVPEVFEISPTHRRAVGTKAIVNQYQQDIINTLDDEGVQRIVVDKMRVISTSRQQGKTAQLTAYAALIAGMLGGYGGRPQERETFYDKYGLSDPKADHDRFNAAEAKRQRKNAKRLKRAV